MLLCKTLASGKNKTKKKKKIVGLVFSFSCKGGCSLPHHFGGCVWYPINSWNITINHSMTNPKYRTSNYKSRESLTPQYIQALPYMLIISNCMSKNHEYCAIVFANSSPGPCLHKELVQHMESRADPLAETSSGVLQLMCTPPAAVDTKMLWECDSINL